MKQTKKQLLTLLTVTLLALMLFAVHAAAADSGTCGDNLTWTLDDYGTLTISGSGEMGDSFSWKKHKEIIQHVVIEDGVTSVSTLSFSHYPALSDVFISASVETIEHSFSGCTSLTDVRIAEENAFFMADESGCIYNKEQTVLIQYPCGRAESTYSIPEGVTTISKYAFYDCPKIQTVTFPESLTTIESSAFYHCVSLAGLSLPKGLTSIEADAFAICGNCASITVAPGNLMYSSHKAGCLYNHDKTILIQYPCGRQESSFTIPSSVLRVGKLAFSACKTLQSLTIPKSVVSIAWSAFSNVDNLKDIYYEGKQSGNMKAGETWDFVSVEGDNDPILFAEKHWETVIENESEEPFEMTEVNDEATGKTNRFNIYLYVCIGEAGIILVLAIVLVAKRKKKTS